MFNKTRKEIKEFTQGIDTIKSQETLLDYMNSSFYSSIKLLISVSKTFSIYWKVVLPFIISLGVLFILLIVEPIKQQLSEIFNASYILGIFLFLLILSFIYIQNCRKYFIFSIEDVKINN